MSRAHRRGTCYQAPPQESLVTTKGAALIKRNLLNLIEHFTGEVGLFQWNNFMFSNQFGARGIVVSDLFTIQFASF